MLHSSSIVWVFKLYYSQWTVQNVDLTNDMVTKKDTYLRFKDETFVSLIPSESINPYILESGGLS